MLALAPVPAFAKKTLGVLNHGSSVVTFIQAGNTVIVEADDSPGTRDVIQVAIKDLGCTTVGTNHTMTMHAKGLNMRRPEVATRDLVTYNFQKSNGRTWVYDKDADLNALALAERLNRLAHCK